VAVLQTDKFKLGQHGEHITVDLNQLRQICIAPTTKCGQRCLTTDWCKNRELGDNKITRIKEIKDREN